MRGNRATDLRYGLHYMFSDDNVFEDNVFENGAAGAALMYSNRMQFRRNRFVRNRGFASVGLLLKACDDVVAEDNLLADNARGIFLEGSNRNRFTRNVVAMSDMALVVYDSSGANVFEGNAFIGNLTPLSLSGRRTDTRFDGNYWSDHREPDLDGDGVGRPALSSVQRLRSSARQSHRCRPVRSQHRRGGAGRRRAGVSGARPRARSSMRIRWRDLPVCRTCRPNQRPRGLAPPRALACPRCSCSWAVACSWRAGVRRCRRGGCRDRLRGVHQALRRADGCRWPHPQGAAGIGRRAARPERVGKDDLDQGRGRADPTGRR